MNQSLHAQRERSELDADARTEHRIGEDREAVDANQDGAVTDPGSMHPFRGPRGKLRDAGRRLDGTLSILGQSSPEHRRGLKHKSRE